MALNAKHKQPEDSGLGQVLANDIYLRGRVQPSRRDLDYLILSDLRQSVKLFAEQAKGDLFDYGCGGSPYREAFKACSSYIRADVTPGPGIDRLLSPEGPTSEPPASYDVVFSSQVLEHVKKPAEYLRECFRLLKPGGKLFLSTHGQYHEHGCPYDFYRWTSRGLEEMAEAAGFKVERSSKITAGVRGIIQTNHYFVEHLRCREDRPLFHFAFALFRRCYRLGLPVLNFLADRFSSQAILPGDDPVAIYAGVAIWAEKPRAGGESLPVPGPRR